MIHFDIYVNKLLRIITFLIDENKNIYILLLTANFTDYSTPDIDMACARIRLLNSSRSWLQKKKNYIATILI